MVPLPLPSTLTSQVPSIRLSSSCSFPGLGGSWASVAGPSNTLTAHTISAKRVVRTTNLPLENAAAENGRTGQLRCWDANCDLLRYSALVEKSIRYCTTSGAIYEIFSLDGIAGRLISFYDVLPKIDF